MHCAGRGWRTREFVLWQARRYFERIAEEGIDLDLLTDAEDPFIAAVGRCCFRYETLLDELGILDLSRLQAKADELLQDDAVARRVGASIAHLQVDEYQDTSGGQERILLRLAQAHGNPCVVGDDDQSIYRFRGASVRNLLEFPKRFPDATVRHLRRQLSFPSRHRLRLQRLDGLRRLEQPGTRRYAPPPPQDDQTPQCRQPRRLPVGGRPVGQ